jgi:hypothetical protein
LCDILCSATKGDIKMPRKVKNQKDMRHVCMACGHIFNDYEYAQSCGCANESFVDPMGCGLVTYSAVDPLKLRRINVNGKEYKTLMEKLRGKA